MAKPTRSIPGRMTRDELERSVSGGEIETVLAVFPDLYGRLMGKRFVGRFFVERVAEYGMHACDYLLACDIEMDPVPGYRFTSWETGYGDFRMIPDMSTMRVVPWLEKTAMVLSDTFTEEEHDEIAVSPRTILKRQGARAAASSFMNASLIP